MSALSGQVRRDALPDAANTPPDVECPLCGYNLHGLGEPRCPECGYRFDWADLLDPTRRRHPYLFEHHPERNVGSFIRTLGGALRPRTFWRGLHPAQPSRPRRLAAYWAVSAVAYTLAVIGPVAYDTIELARWNARTYATDRAKTLSWVNASAEYRARIVAQFGSVEAYLNARHPKPMTAAWLANIVRTQRLDLGAVAAALSPLPWPWLVLLALLVFQVSMAKARIRTAHVLRCVVYSIDLTCWLALVVGVGSVVHRVNLAFAVVGPRTWIARVFSDRNFVWIVVATIVLCLLASTYRLTVAYRHYLKFPRPVATVLLAHGVALLALVNLLAVPMWLR